MGEQRDSRKSNLLWLLLLLAVLLLWIYFRPSGSTGASDAEIEADRLAAIGADADEILVDLDDDVDEDRVRALEKQLGIDLVLVSDQSEDERFYRAKVDPMRQAALLEVLANHPDVEIAEPDATFQLDPNSVHHVPAAEAQWADFPNDPQYKFQWHMGQINMPNAWKLADGDGVVVAVLDTGVAYENYNRFHAVEDLEGVELVKPFDFVGNTSHANDDHGHGTHVAGTIAQATNNGKGVAGVARKVKIMPLKVLSGSGSGSVAGIADAIRYAADEGAQVINMSLGGRFPSAVLKKAVAYAHKKGVVVVCAAGNDGRGKIGYPAAYPGAVAVAATQFDRKTTFYSNWGKHLDIAAPGGNTRIDQNKDGQPDGVLQNTIVVGDPTKSGYFGFMGTSMASPHAAGVAALVVGEGITNPDAVEQILKDTANQPAGYSAEHYGAGLIDAEAAVLKARSQTGGWQFVLGGLLAGAVALGMRRRVNLGGGFAAGVLFGSGGLFFLPHLSATLSSWPGVSLLTRGLPSWDLGVFGAAGHGNVLFFSALVPLVLVALLFGVPKARGPLAGLLLGVAGHLLFHAVAGVTGVQWMVLDTAWLVANSALLVWVARSILSTKPSEV